MSKLQEGVRGVADWRGHLFLALVMAVFAFFSFRVYIGIVPVGAPPDELAHLTYVGEIATEGRWLPDYENSVVLNSTQANYLNHPPLYYSLLGGVGRAFHWSPVGQYAQYRAVSALLVSIGIFCWGLSLGFMGETPLRTVGMIVAACAIPMFPYLAASINNDDLAYLGVALFFLGQSMRRQFTNAGYWLGAIGVIITLLSKATATVFLLAFIAIWLVLRWRAGEAVIKSRSFQWSALLVAVVCGLYYIPTVLTHGTAFPKAGELYQPAHPPHMLGFFEYAKAFITQMIARLPGVMSHRSYAPIPQVMVPIFYVMLLAPLLGWATCRPFILKSEKRDSSDAFMAALALTVLLHLWVAWGGYQRTGLMGGIQPRYYSYALPGLFVFSFLDASESRLKQWLFACFVLAAAICIAVIPAMSMRKLTELKQASIARPETSIPFLTDATPGVEITVSVVSGLPGYVDRIELAEGKLAVAGWAVDVRTKTAARLVWIAQGNRMVASFVPDRARPDVAKALASLGASDSGFDATIVGVPQGLDPCTLTFFAQQAGGSLAQLRAPRCSDR